MIALVLFLVLERVKGIAPKGMDITQGAIEAFVTDMDDCLREMGVGDLTVPKKVKRAAAAFYERSGVYRAALSSSDEAGLAKAFVNYIYQGKDTPAALGLARLVAEQSRALAVAPDDNVLNAASLTAVMGSIAFGARSQTPNTNNESLA
jgi:cytochrome b pre-mRNA-processing protein 3